MTEKLEVSTQRATVPFVVEDGLVRIVDDKIKISWSQPNNGGLPLIDYTVTIRAKNGEEV